jgi:polyphenol oxidase
MMLSKNKIVSKSVDFGDAFFGTSVEHGFGSKADGAWLAPDAHAWARQVHGDTIFVADSAGCQGDGDAIVTRQKGLWVGVRTADCIPILLADAEAGVAAAAHAGWRGTVAEIGAKTVRQMLDLGAKLGQIRAAIGPGIGLCCFEVGPEVSEHFGLSGQVCVDLAGANRRQLEGAGLDAGQIEVLPYCTRCDATRFHSYRRDGAAAGRLLSAIRLRA